MRASVKLSSGSVARERAALPDDGATALGGRGATRRGLHRHDDAQRVEAANGLDPLSIAQHRAQTRSKFVRRKAHDLARVRRVTDSHAAARLSRASPSDLSAFATRRVFPDTSGMITSGRGHKGGAPARRRAATYRCQLPTKSWSN